MMENTSRRNIISNFQTVMRHTGITSFIAWAFAHLDRRFFQKPWQKSRYSSKLMSANSFLRTFPYSSVSGWRSPQSTQKVGCLQTYPKWLAGITALDTRCGLQSAGGAACTDRYGKVRRFYLVRRITPYSSVSNHTFITS